MTTTPGSVRPDRPTRVPFYRSRFFQVAFLVLVVCYAYLGLRLIGPSGLHGGLAVVAWGMLVALLAMVPAAFSIRWGSMSAGWARGFLGVHYCVLGLVFLTLNLLVVRDVLWLIAQALGPGLGWVWLIPADAVDRAGLLRTTNLGLLGLVTILAVYGYREATRPPRIRRTAIWFPGLHTDLDGLRIAQITDMHVGTTIGRRFVDGVVRRVNALAPDLVAVTGDLVDGSVARLGHEVAGLAELSAPLGVYFVTGNHEYYSGVSDWLDELPRLGIDVLVNRHRHIERGGARLLVAGVTDPTGRRFAVGHRSDPAGALNGASRADLRVLLAHQPRTAAEAAEVGFDLQLSGHTHGGQILPWALLVRLVQPAVAGLYRIGAMWLYVSRGTGYWGPPFRIGAPSEITLLELRRGAPGHVNGN